MKYTKLIQDSVFVMVKDNERKCFIPVDSANADYVDYLAWVALGNTPDEQVIS
jgi:hypothetical protein